ncbi:MAG: extracellular solute-binding protein [Acidobacteria bacterium]|nr:extracellular solute-binding protein [Acidobacteriota bacterium]
MTFHSFRRQKRFWPILFLASCLLPLAACRGRDAGKTPLVVYSTHGKELLTEFETSFERNHTDVDVRWLDMGSQDVLDRVRSEKENPQADVWWGAPSMLFQQAEKEGLLQAYRPSWAGEVGPEAHSAGDFWYGTYETPEVIAYNSAVLKPEEAPQDWDELLDAKWQNKIILRDPLASGTMRTIFCAMILRSYKATGAPEAGYDWLKKLDANTKDYVANLTLLSQKLARQEGILTLWNMPDIELQRAQYNYPLAYIIPKSGTPVVTDGIALVNQAKHADAAKQLYEYVTRKESIVLAAKKFYRIPCRKDIPSQDLPEWIRQTPIQTMPIDWKILEEKSNEWMKYWDSQIRNKGRS